MDEAKREALCAKERYSLDDLRTVVAMLRAPDGCPWDRVQTHESIRSEFIEEVYEAVDTIDRSDRDGMREELGDVLFQVVFHARIAEEDGWFSWEDVCDEVCRKMIVRHPHVFGQITRGKDGSELRDWEAIKDETHHVQSATEALQAIPRTLPALMRASKLGKKSRKLGFDWETAEDAMEKVQEELAEVQEVLPGQDAARTEEEFGDLLLAVVSAARLAGVNAEQALTNACEKYLARFAAVERQCTLDGKTIAQEDRETLLAYWRSAKSEFLSKK